MMSQPELLVLRLVLAFALGSIWITIVTIVADRFGRVVSGLLAGIPSTAAFSYLFIGINQSTVIASQATTDYPLFFSFTAAFALFYSHLSKKIGCVYSLLLSLFVWFLLTFAVVASGIRSFTIGLLTVVAVSAIAYILLTRSEKGFVNLKEKTSAVGYSWTELAVRALISGLIVDSAVFMSQSAGPIFGAIFSSFPAIMTSTFYLTNRSRGLNFSRGMAKPMMVSMVMDVIPYIATLRYAYPVLGIMIGTLVSYAVTAPFVLASYLVLSSKEDRKAITRMLRDTSGQMTDK